MNEMLKVAERTVFLAELLMTDTYYGPRQSLFQPFPEFLEEVLPGDPKDEVSCAAFDQIWTQAQDMKPYLESSIPSIRDNRHESSDCQIAVLRGIALLAAQQAGALKVAASLTPSAGTAPAAAAATAAPILQNENWLEFCRILRDVCSLPGTKDPSRPKQDSAPEYWQRLGERFEIERERRDLTKKQMAELANVGQEFIAGIERGYLFRPKIHVHRVRVRFAKLNRVADVLGIDLLTLMKECQKIPKRRQA